MKMTSMWKNKIKNVIKFTGAQKGKSCIFIYLFILTNHALFLKEIISQDFIAKENMQ